MTLLTSRKVYMDIALTLATYKSTRTPPESEVRICITCSGGFIRPDALLVASDWRLLHFPISQAGTLTEMGAMSARCGNLKAGAVEGGHREEGRDGRGTRGASDGELTGILGDIPRKKQRARASIQLHLPDPETKRV